MTSFNLPAETIRINAAKRAIVAPHRLSACLVTGTDKVRRRYGNGDCLLLDLGSGFFAVADGSERWPSASSDFLRRLAGRFSRGPRPVGGEAWLREVNEAYASQHLFQTTTFSGVAVEGERGAQTLRVLHGGDSRILLFNLQTRRVEYVSSPDMNFAGRAPALSRVVSLPLKEDSYRLIMATDGIGDLARLSGQRVETLCIEALLRFQVHEIPERLMEFLARRRGKAEHDDIGIVALDPGAVADFQGGQFLLGGTTPAEEERFQRLRGDVLRDRWISPAEGNFLADDLELAGIRVLSLTPPR